MTYTLQLETPVGPVTITATGEAVTQIRFGTEIPEGSAAVPETSATPLLLKAATQLREYFAGTRRDFSLPLAPAGTPFQQSVWQALQTIPYGETRTYGHIAVQIGHNKSFRAVGMANTATPSSSSFPATAFWATTANSRATPGDSTSRSGCSTWKSGDKRTPAAGLQIAPARKNARHGRPCLAFAYPVRSKSERNGVDAVVNRADDAQQQNARHAERKADTRVTVAAERRDRRVGGRNVHRLDDQQVVVE